MLREVSGWTSSHNFSFVMFNLVFGLYERWFHSPNVVHRAQIDWI